MNPILFAVIRNVPVRVIMHVVLALLTGFVTGIAAANLGGPIAPALAAIFAAAFLYPVVATFYYCSWSAIRGNPRQEPSAIEPGSSSKKPPGTLAFIGAIAVARSGTSDFWSIVLIILAIALLAFGAFPIVGRLGRSG